MIFKKPDKRNVFKHIWRNVSDSNHGLLIMLKESSTVQRLIPLEIAFGIILGVVFGYVALEYIIMGAAIIMIFTTETINSAIEEVNDLVTDQVNDKVKRSKDMASASVWTWHLVYIVCVFVFLVMHIAHFAWWAHIIPS